MALVSSLLVCVSCEDGGQAVQEIIEPANLVKSATGLQYFDNDTGTGKTVKKGDMLRTHYLGWVIPKDESDLYSDWAKDSTKFTYKVDDSYEANQPYIFYIGYGEAIPGWEEGLIGMLEGGTRTLIIPDSLAYGSEQIGSKVPPNSNLRYVVELLDVRTPARVWQADDTKKVVADNGLVFIPLQEGTGRQPKKGDLVTFHLTISTTDSTIMFSSVEAEQPVVVPVAIAPTLEGLDQGILMMKEKGRAKLIVPPELGYGDEEVNDIPANSTIVIDVELLKVEEQEDEEF